MITTAHFTKACTHTLYAIPLIGDAIKLKNTYAFCKAPKLETHDREKFSEDLAFYAVINTVKLVALGIFAVVTGNPVPFIAYAVVKLAVSAIHIAAYIYRQSS